MLAHVQMEDGPFRTADATAAVRVAARDMNGQGAVYALLRHPDGAYGFAEEGPPPGVRAGIPAAARAEALRIEEGAEGRLLHATLFLLSLKGGAVSIAPVHAVYAISARPCKAEGPHGALHVTCTLTPASRETVARVFPPGLVPPTLSAVVEGTERAEPAAPAEAFTGVADADSDAAAGVDPVALCLSLARGGKARARASGTGAKKPRPPRKTGLTADKESP